MVNITSTNNGVNFAFTNSQYYLFGTGSIDVPLNSLSLVIDESDMVTFKKAASDDVFISVPLDQTNFATKAALISFYKENMVGGNAEMTEAFTGVSYDAEAQELIFTNIDDEEVATLDVSAFVLDGMLDNVEVENGYLVFTFNTASGKETISIPLSAFFDASQYYTKTDIEDILNPKEQAIAEALTELHENKADKTEIPTVPTNVSSFTNDAGYIDQDEVIAYKPIPSGWDITHTMADLISDINSDTDAVTGRVYLDTVSLTDLPASLQQAEMKIEIISESSGLGKVILFTFTSSNQTPYHWEYTSAYGAAGTWREWVTPTYLSNNYYDKNYIDTTVGDINTILQSI